MDDFLKKMAHLHSDFRDVQQQIDAKVDHMLEMLASMQLQLQMQGMTKGEEIGDDFSFAEPQLHNLPCLPLRRTEGESEILPSNQHRSPSSHDSCAAQLESEGFVGVLNHKPITTTMAKSRFGEPKSEVLADLKLDKPKYVFEILPKQPLVVYLHSVAIESSKNNDAQKVFDKLIRRDLNPLKEVSVFVDLGKEIYIYVEENIVKNEPTDATLINCFEMNDIESIMSFDPGGDSKVSDFYKKLFYIEELVLLQDCSNYPRSVSLSFCLNFGKLMHTHMEISRRFVIMFVNSDWVESYATLLNINSVAMVFNDNSLISKGRHYEIYTPRVCDIGFFLKSGGVMLEISCGYGVTSTGITHEGGDIFSRDVFDVFHTEDDGGNFILQNDISNMEEEYHLGNCCIKYAGVGVAEGHFVVSIKANYIDSIVLAESLFAAEVKKLQVEHFKLIEMVILEPFEQYHVCDWIKMFDGLLSKLPSQFRYMSCEDTTHSRGKNCCGNGRVRVWRIGRGRVIGGAEFRSRKASQLGHLNILFQNLTMEISSLANICTLLHSSPRGNPIAENLGIKLWECLRDFIIPTTLKDDISNLVLFGLRGIIGAMLKPLFHEFCVGAIWSFFMTYKLYDVEKVGEPPVLHVTDELDSHLLDSAASNFRFPHSLCLSANLSPSAGHSILLPKKCTKNSCMDESFNAYSTFAETSFPFSTFESWGHDSLKGGVLLWEWSKARRKKCYGNCRRERTRGRDEEEWAGNCRGGMNRSRDEEEWAESLIFSC